MCLKVNGLSKRRDIGLVRELLAPGYGLPPLQIKRLELEFRIGLGKPAKVFIWRKVGPARRVNLPIKKGDLARWVILLAEPTFCF